jgi:preprotein translocase subunit SecA
MTVQVQSREQVEQATEALEQRSAHSLEHMTYGGPSDGDLGGSVEDEPLELPEGVRVGRNDPCPCGSGKKYKQCHGKLS